MRLETIHKTLSAFSIFGDPFQDGSTQTRRRQRRLAAAQIFERPPGTVTADFVHLTPDVERFFSLLGTDSLRIEPGLQPDLPSATVHNTTMPESLRDWPIDSLAKSANDLK